MATIQVITDPDSDSDYEHDIIIRPPDRTPLPTYTRYPRKYEQALRRVWNKRRETSFGLCVICNRCGGSSSSSCGCAYTRWRASLSPSQLAEIIRQFEEDEKEQIRQDIQRLELQLAQRLDNLDKYKSLADRFQQRHI